MGLEWDPEGDAERRRESRLRWWLTIVIVVAALGYIGKMAYRWHLEKERHDAMFRG